MFIRGCKNKKPTAVAGSGVQKSVDYQSEPDGRAAGRQRVEKRQSQVHILHSLTSVNGPGRLVKLIFPERVLKRM